MIVTRGGRNGDRSRTRGKSEKASPGRGMRRKNEGGSGFKGGVQPTWAIAPSPATDRSPRLRKVKPQAAVRVDTDLRIVNQDHTWRPGQTTRSGLFADGETKAWGDKGELLGGHTASPQPRAPEAPTPCASLTPLPLSGLGLPEAPPASAPFLLLPLPLTVTALCRCSAE